MNTGLKATISKVTLKTKTPGSEWLKDPSEFVTYEFDLVDDNGESQMQTYFVYDIDQFNTGSVIQYTENMIELGRHIYTNGILIDIIVPDNDLLLQSQDGFKSWYKCTTELYRSKKMELQADPGMDMLCDVMNIYFGSCYLSKIVASAWECSFKEIINAFD